MGTSSLKGSEALASSLSRVIESHSFSIGVLK